MLRLAAPTREPYWLDLFSGTRVKVRPITSAAIIAARQAAADAIRALPEGDDRIGIGNVAYTRSVALWGILEWDGIGDAAGEPAPVTPENIDALLDIWPAFDALDRKYVSPALIADDEKNGSSLSPSGTSAGATNTARRARKPAKAARTAKANP